MSQPSNIYLVSRHESPGPVLMVQANTSLEAAQFWRGEVQETIRVDTLPLTGFTVTHGPGEVVSGVLGKFTGETAYEGAVIVTNYYVHIPDMDNVNATGLTLLQQAELGVLP